MTLTNINQINSLPQGTVYMIAISGNRILVTRGGKGEITLPSCAPATDQIPEQAAAQILKDLTGSDALEIRTVAKMFNPSGPAMDIYIRCRMVPVTPCKNTGHEWMDMDRLTRHADIQKEHSWYSWRGRRHDWFFDETIAAQDREKGNSPDHRSPLMVTRHLIWQEYSALQRGNPSPTTPAIKVQLTA
ncbi:MAG: hypothetical protein M3O22_00430 [Pseudomonadota bacterium]|nr:hypothetical protein [Pseudomonadota bacterium]